MDDPGACIIYGIWGVKTLLGHHLELLVLPVRYPGPRNDFLEHPRVVPSRHYFTMERNQHNFMSGGTRSRSACNDSIQIFKYS